MKCRICGNLENNKEYEIKEMMYGFRDRFIYFQCSKCGCLQISEILRDMSKYYPSDYYSFALNISENPVKRFIKNIRNNYAVFNKGIIGKVIMAGFPNESMRSLSGVPLTKTSRILDVGCGRGIFLDDLRKIGFKNLWGVDPYIPEKYITDENGFKIIKDRVNNLNGKWDLIMFHHSFEHLPDPAETLRSVSRLLVDGSICLIRIPTVSSFAWEHYKTHWVQIDAPRHFFLHSTDSMRILAEENQMVLKEVVYDSMDFQFWGSEQNAKNIPSMSEQSYSINPKKSIFSHSDIKIFKKKAKKLNSENRGDQAVFYLQKK